MSKQKPVTKTTTTEPAAASVDESMILGGTAQEGELAGHREIVSAILNMPVLRSLTKAEEVTLPTRVSGDIMLYDPAQRRAVQKLTRALMESGERYQHYGRPRAIRGPRDTMIWLVQRITMIVEGAA